MDKRITNVIEVLNAIDMYFESLKDYLKTTDPEKYTTLEKQRARADEFKNEFVKLSKQPNWSARDIFKLNAIFVSLTRLLNKMYKSLDFKLAVDEEISKTRLYRLTDIFNKVSSIYRLYIRDIAAQTSDLSKELSRMVTVDNPEELHQLFQEYPNAVDVYTLCISRMLNAAYQQKDQQRVRTIFNLIEQDKSFILDEQDWLSPFLTFNLKPNDTKDPVSMEKLKTVYPDVDTCNLIIIKRIILNDKIIKPARSVPWGRGISADDITISLQDLQASDIWNWDIEIVDRAATDYIFVEQLREDQYRVLSSGPLRNPKTAIITKIIEKKFGRPAAYHRILEQSLAPMVRTRVANLAIETSRKKEISFKIVKLESQMVESFKSLKQSSYKERLRDPLMDKTFEIGVLEELEDIKLLDALVYWVVWIKKQFRQDLNKAIVAADIKETTEEYVFDQVSQILRDTVANLVKKHKNIFQDIYDKQHILDVIVANT